MSRHSAEQGDYDEFLERYNGTFEDFQKLTESEPYILHMGRLWGFNDTEVRERIYDVAEKLGLDSIYV